MTDVESARRHQAQIDELWDFEDPPGSEARFRAAADAAPEPECDILRTQVARALGLAGDHAGAIATLDGLHVDTPEVRVRALLERARVLNSSGAADEARPLFQAAFEATTEAGFEFLAIDALHMLAIVAPADEQVALNRRALDLATAALDPRARRWRASLLNNMAWSAFDRGALDEALALFEEAVVERDAAGAQSELLVARWCVARTLRELGRRDEALVIQRSLADAHRAAGTSDSYVDEELAALQGSTTPEPGSG